MSKVMVGNPFTKVEFATESGDIEIKQSVIATPNMDFDILSVNTTRDIGADDCATFSIELVYKEVWYNNINANDFVKIEFGRGEASKPVLFGMVDNIYKSFNFVDLKPIRTIQVHGRGFNKALMQFGIGAIHEIDTTFNMQGFYEGQSGEFGMGSPAEVIKNVLDYYTNKGIDMQYANGKRWIDYVAFDYRDSGREGSLANMMNYYNYQGALWDYIKELRNAPFNEVFWEVENGRPTFKVRPTPFNPDGWNSLNTKVLDAINIIDENLGRSDLETYTVYSVKAEHFISNMNLIFGLPIWYKPYYRKYGLRRLEVNSKYIDNAEAPNYQDTGFMGPGRTIYTDEKVSGSNVFDNNTMKQAYQASMSGSMDGLLNPGGIGSLADNVINTPRPIEEAEQIIREANQVDQMLGGAGRNGGISQKTIDLFNWNIKNAIMENGTITIKGDNSIKVGEKLVVPSNDKVYYIEKVNHIFNYGEHWITSIEATRGLKEDDRFTSPWNQWSVMTAEDLIEISGIDPGSAKIAMNPTPPQRDSSNGDETAKPTNSNSAPNGKTIDPLGGKGRLTSGYGKRRAPKKGASTFHEGIDLAAPKGTPILAFRDGTVIFSGTKGNGLGNYVNIDHGGGITSVYGHASKLNVKKGDVISAGTKIAEVGSTGVSTGPHLHFEVRVNGDSQNPKNYIKR